MHQQMLLDTSFLLALWNPRDKFHQRAIRFASQIRQTTVIPAPVLVELFYMLAERVNYRTAVEGYLKTQTAAFHIEPLIDADMQRMSEIMQKYMDNHFDLPDLAIMAMSERLNINTICTFDDEDYHAFRPKHTDYLTILP